MPFDLTVRVHSIAEDGLPDMDRLVGQVAFIFDGCIVSGWPLRVDPTDHNTPYSGAWKANSDVGHTMRFLGVTHWVEFPRPVWDIERDPADTPSSPPGRQPGVSSNT